MAEQVTHNPRENFTGEEYYQFSRRRYWTICEFLRLVFNDKSLRYPEKETAEFNYLHIIFDGIQDNSIESFKLDDPHPRSLRPLVDPHELLEIPMGQPHDYLPSHEKYIVTTRVSAKQAFGYAYSFHLAMDLPNSDFFYDFFEVKKAIKLPKEFLKMGEEIDPQSSFLETLKARDAWTIKDLIRIIFGERFKKYENLNDENFDNFITLIKASINAKSISPINLNQDGKELDIFYKSTDLVDLIWGEKVFAWLMKNGIDVLEWVEDLFDHVKIEESIRFKESNAEKLSSVEKQHKEKSSFFPAPQWTTWNPEEGQFDHVKIEDKAKEKNAEILSEEEKQHKENQSFLPAPDGTTWSDVGFVLTKDRRIRININSRTQLLNFKKLESKFRQKKSFRFLLCNIISGPTFSKETIQDLGAKEYLNQYISALRGDLRELFKIDSDPIKSLGKGEYRTNFSAVTPFYDPSPKQYQTDLEDLISPEDNISFGRHEEGDTSFEEDQLDSPDDSPLDFYSE